MSEPTPTSPTPEPDAATPESAPLPDLENADDQGRLRAVHEMLFDRNPDGIAYADPAGNIVLNPAAMVMLGIKKQENDSGVERWSEAFGLFLPDGKTPYPPEELPLARALRRREQSREVEMFTKNPDAPEGRCISVSASPMPGGNAICVFRDVTERKRLEVDLAQRNAELAEQMRENNSLIERLRLAVDELSTPVLELADDILALPVVGIVDTVRSTRMMEKILAEVVARRCRAVIIDVTGVDVIDTGTADRLIRIARSIELLGADCVICGVQPAVAQTLADLGVSFSGLTTKRNLKRALELCIARLQNSRAGHTG